MVSIEGVDYSTTPPGSAALKDAGKHFVVRYLARDYRGITTAEYLDLKSAGIDVAVVYESNEARAKDGRVAGIYDATFAINVMADVGLPERMPIYFAVDFDADQSDQPAIDDYLRGCADVIGADRVGVYGGFYVVQRCHENGTANWFWQTYAWSGGRVYPENHLYQYDNYDNLINGTDVDFNQAMKENYGQASKFIGATPVDSTYAKPASISWKAGDVGTKDLRGTPALAFVHQVRVVKQKVTPWSDSTETHATGPDLAYDSKQIAIGSYKGGPHRNGFVVLEDGSRVRRTSVRPLLPLPEPT